MTPAQVIAFWAEHPDMRWVRSRKLFVINAVETGTVLLSDVLVTLKMSAEEYLTWMADLP